MKKPLVSIITPSYNQAQFLETTIESVLQQDYAAIEYIIVDGGSDDGSVDIIKSCSERIARWVSEPDHGQGDAINKGFRIASGKYIAWINSDDVYTRGAVSAAIAALEAHPEVGLVYGDGILVDAAGRILDWHPYRQYDALDLICFNVLLQPAVFMRREVLQKAGYLNEDFHLVLDHDLWIRMALQAPLLYVPQYWAAERTYAAAKTVADAAGFVMEAEKLILQLREKPQTADLMQQHDSLVEASLQTFAGRRLIDAGHYKQALCHFRRAMGLNSAVVRKYWYKVVQALMGRVGLEKLFLWYRNSRRKLQHHNQFLSYPECGQSE